MALKTYSREFTVASAGTEAVIFVENWDTLGLIVPALDSTTLKIQVGMTSGGTYYDVKDGFGTQVLTYPAGTGGFAIDSRDMAAVAAYQWIKVVCGSAQSGGARTFTLTFDAPKRQ